MDINNNQQTNTFIKGMDTDTSDMYIGEGSYRYAENLRVVTNKDSNSGELHIIEGTEKVSGHTAKITVDKDNEITPRDDQQLLGFTSIRDYIIEIVKHGNSWSIVRVDKQGNRTLVAGPFNKPIWPNNWDGKTKPLSLVTRWEADDNIKLYIATGKTELLVINIAETNQGTDFDEVFQGTKTILNPIVAEVTDRSGATIPGVVVQYAYITYKKRGRASSLSILSSPVSITKDNVSGFESETNATKIVNLTLPSDMVGNFIRVYRIAYPKAGQLPKVDVVYDQECVSTLVIDSGQSLENISSSEFVATNKLLIVPKEIESKGDYLFAGNVTYTQDQIDSTFNNFDARCFSKGSYYTENGSEVEIFGEHSSLETDQLINDLSGTIDIHNHQFDAGVGYEYDFNNWQSVAKTIDARTVYVNGYGKCFAWKYEYNPAGLYFNKQYNGAESKRTYARNEVYRFGVRLFDEKGNASSVKWIADIKMPGYCPDFGVEDTTMQAYVISGDNAAQRQAFVTTNNLDIKFFPINTNSECWKGVAKYEIVQARRSIDDSYKISQGICGFPQGITADENGTLVRDHALCMPYFLTTCPFYVRRGISHINEGNYEYMQVVSYLNTVLDHELYHGYYKNSVLQGTLIFASPECVYQQDDVQKLLKNNSSSLSCKGICAFTRDAWVKYGTSSTFNFAESSGEGNTPYAFTDTNKIKLLEYPTGTDLIGVFDMLHNGLNVPHTDLKIQLTPANKYYLTQQVMAFNSDNGSTQWNTLGHSEKNATKPVYFTNMYASNVWPDNFSVNRNITRATFVEESNPDDFAKDEWPTYRNKFVTLSNGKKFYNWTNPVMLSPDIYSKFTEGGDATKESFLNTTATAYDSSAINYKKWEIVASWNNTFEEKNEFIGSYGLTFPTSPGGSCVILELGGPVSYTNAVNSYLSGLLQSQGTEEGRNASAPMPQIPVCNICKSATPYGGDNITARNNTQYISFGKVGDKNTPVVMNCGDNFITMFVYMPYHCFDNNVNDSVTTAAVQYIVPIESTMDLSKQCSEYLQATHCDTLKVERGGKGVWVQAHPSTVAGRFTQTADMYMYNTAYSILPDVVTYSAEDTVNAASALYDSRIHYSQKKQNNELIDNWSNFKAIDFLDVDSRYGQITGLKLFKDKLVFLQENGAGVLSVNDRIILKDQESANIIVGNGGVLDRYDYFTTMYGMKPEQHAIESSNDALYWWDGHRREIISYVDGYNVALLQRLKNVSNYINSRVDSDTPSIIYDTNNKEVLFNVVKPNSSANGETLVYNEQIQQFTSVYTFSPIYYCNINGEIFLTDNWENGPKLYKYNKQSVAGPLLFGELVYSEWDEDEPAGSNEHEMDDEEEYGHEFGDELPIELMAASSPRRSSRPSEEIWSNKALPKLKFVVNKDPIYNKVFDLQTFGGDFYNGDVTKLTFAYNTPLGQSSTTSGTHPITKRECDYRLAIPRDDNRSYGGRMRGKTMECELTSRSNDYDFSIQYITTKYRMSWS